MVLKHDQLRHVSDIWKNIKQREISKFRNVAPKKIGPQQWVSKGFNERKSASRSTDV